MKLYNLPILAARTLNCCLMGSILFFVNCHKEKAPQPSNLDQNYFVISDNPNDPVDHAIYEFYKSTGIAIFYKDSIYKKKISREDEIPARYAYIKLTLEYAPLGNTVVYSKPLTSRSNIQPLLKLMQEELIPKLPLTSMIPSILLVDSFADMYSFVDMQISHGWTALYGFNTIGIAVREVAAMNSEERKMYVASLLAGIAVKRIYDLKADQAQKDFFSITRAATKTMIPVDIYSGLPWLFFLEPPYMEPPPQDIGLLFYPILDFDGMLLSIPPRESDDLRAFLTAAFYYTNQEFADLHPNESLVLQKFYTIRNIAKDVGFKIPD